jgi:hypothetical protein
MQPEENIRIDLLNHCPLTLLRPEKWPVAPAAG